MNDKNFNSTQPEYWLEKLKDMTNEEIDKIETDFQEEIDGYENNFNVINSLEGGYPLDLANEQYKAFKEARAMLEKNNAKKQGEYRTTQKEYWLIKFKNMTDEEIEAERRKLEEECDRYNDNDDYLAMDLSDGGYASTVAYDELKAFKKALEEHRARNNGITPKIIEDATIGINATGFNNATRGIRNGITSNPEITR